MMDDISPYDLWEFGQIQRAGGNIADEDPDLAEWLGEDWEFDTDPMTPRHL